MKLSRASSYPLAYLAHLAREKQDRPVASHDVARELDLPERFLLKVLTPLVSMGILRSVKGPNGGYSLARPPKDITLLEVVEAVDGPLRSEAGPAGEQGRRRPRQAVAGRVRRGPGPGAWTAGEGDAGGTGQGEVKRRPRLSARGAPMRAGKV
jgi:Rrf2 family protein